MRVHTPERVSVSGRERVPVSGRRTTPLAACATAAASMFALVMPLGLPASAMAGSRGAPGHRTSLHVATASSHGPHAGQFHMADLTTFSAPRASPVRGVSVVSGVHAHERLTPTASARGPPGPATNR